MIIITINLPTPFKALKGCNSANSINNRINIGIISLLDNIISIMSVKWNAKRL